jgi:hypothetical protein
MVIDVIKLGIRWALIAVFFIAPVPVLGEETCTITSIRVSNAPERRIAPGEPIALAFEVDADCVGLEGDGPRGHRQEPRLHRMVGRALSEHVELDDTVFRNRLSEGMHNEIVVFEPKPSVAGAIAGVGVTGAPFRRTFSFVGNVFLIASKKNPRFALEDPGLHTLVFGKAGGPQATVSVIVDAPTPDEKAVMEKLYADDLLLVLAMVDDCTGYSRERLLELTKLLEQAKGTRYEKYLSVAVGIGSMCELQRKRINELERTLERGPGAHVDRESYEEGLLAFAKFFERANPVDIDSEFDIVALWHLGGMELLRAKKAPSQAESERHLAEFSRLYERIDTSPLTSARWSERIRTQDKLVADVRSAIARSKVP